jgi:ankyrin repeat protein
MINRPDSKKITAMNHAARAGNIGCIRLLLESKAVVTQADFDAARDESARFVMGAGSDAALASMREADDKGDTMLHRMVARDDFVMVGILLAAGADAAAVNRKNVSPLMLAAYHGSIKCLAALLAALKTGGNTQHVNHRDDTGETALYQAVARNAHQEVIPALLAADADRGVAANDGSLPTHAAAARGHGEAMRLLLAAEKEAAAAEGRPAGLQGEGAAVGAGGTDAAGEALCQPDASKDTPLILAAEKGRTQMVELILAEFAARPHLMAHVDARGSAGNTALMLAKTADTMAALLAAGADPSAENDAGSCAWRSATGDDRAELMLERFARGSVANIDAANALGDTPIVAAFRKGQTPLVARLLAADADPTVVDKKGRSLLGRAACHEHGAAAMALFIARMQDATWRSAGRATLRTGRATLDDLSGKVTPLTLAAQFNRTETAQLLIEDGGADVRIADGSRGRTALHWAAEHGNVALVVTITRRLKQLEDSRTIGLKTTEPKPKTALMLAVRYEEAVVALKAAGANDNEDENLVVVGAT